MEGDVKLTALARLVSLFGSLFFWFCFVLWFWFCFVYGWEVLNTADTFSVCNTSSPSLSAFTEHWLHDGQALLVSPMLCELGPLNVPFLRFSMAQRLKQYAHGHTNILANVMRSQCLQSGLSASQTMMYTLSSDPQPLSKSHTSEPCLFYSKESHHTGQFLCEFILQGLKLLLTIKPLSEQ